MTIRPLTRRAFVAAGVAGLGVYASGGFFPKENIPQVPTFIRGAASKSGHLLRQGNFPEPTSRREVDVAIVGGGIAGLSAAWRLHKRGFRNFEILELEVQPGGNSQSGANEISAFPWGAHYVPLPGPEAVFVRELFEEIGVITGHQPDGTPIYDELALCAAPNERLLIQGHWQEGMLPEVGATAADKEDYKKFFSFIEEMRKAKGSDGRHAFTIPTALSSQDKKFLSYDQISMSELLKTLGVSSSYLHWYLTYCYRDDYGADLEHVSAWAGIHYFAGRRSDENGAGESDLVTWPEGNGFLVRKLVELVGKERITSNALTFHITNSSEGGNDVVNLRYLDTASGKVTELRAKKLIYAAPRFTAQHVIKELQLSRPAYLANITYAPWVVANISLLAPRDLKHLDKFAWDNVFYGGESLGFVNATHQSIKRANGETVLTYYLPLSFEDPAIERKRALETTPEEWRNRIVAELLRFQPQLASRISQLDVWIWGHAMRVPAPGAVWGETRMELQKPLGGIHFAHSDMSGFSIFEEAQYHGVMAADAILSAINV